MDDKKKPTIGALLLATKPKRDPLDDIIESEDEMEEEDGELPDGLLEAVSEMREAESDEDAARAMMRAVRACRGGP